MSASERPFRRQVLRNTASAGAANVWAMVVALVSVPLLLRGLGSTAFGSWVLLQTLSAVNGWLSLADLGLRVSATRAVADRAAVGDRDAVTRLVATTLAIYVAAAAIAAALVASAGPPLLPRLFSTPPSLAGDVRFAVRVMALQIALELVAAAAGASLEGVQRVDIARGLDSVRRTLVAVATCGVALQDGGLRGVAVASAAATAAGTVVSVVALSRHASLTGRPHVGEARALMRYGTTVGLLNATGVLHRTMDRLIVGAVFGPAKVALVEIATQVQNGASAVLSASSYATLSSAPWLRARGDRTSLRELLARGTRYSVMVTVPFVALAAVLGDPLVRVWVGRQFTEAGGLVTIAVLYIGAAAPMQVGSNLLQGVGKAGLVLRAAAVAVVVNLGASLVLVHTIGVVGVFIGTLIGTAALAPPLLRAISTETGMPVTELGRTISRVIAPAFAAAAVAGAMLALPLGDAATVALGAGLGGLVYVAITTRFVVTRDELTELASYIRKDGATDR